MRKDLASRQAAMRMRQADIGQESPKKYNQRNFKKTNIQPISIVNNPSTQKVQAKPITINRKSEHLDVTPVQETLLVPESPYTELCLPQTMALAQQSKKLLYPLLRPFPKSWSFPDKVLVMLAPSFLQDVRSYYSNDGLSMVGMFESNQIEYFDKLLLRDLTKLLTNIKQYNSGRA